MYLSILGHEISSFTVITGAIGRITFGKSTGAAQLNYFYLTQVNQVLNQKWAGGSGSQWKSLEQGVFIIKLFCAVLQALYTCYLVDII